MGKLSQGFKKVDKFYKKKIEKPIVSAGKDIGTAAKETGKFTYKNVVKPVAKDANQLLKNAVSLTNPSTLLLIGGVAIVVFMQMNKQPIRISPLE